jgi:pyruvate kinase
MRLLATLGPSSLNEKTVRQCAEHGIYLFRINLSHTPLDEVEDTIKKIRKWTDVPICLDSEGAQLRNQNMRSGSVVFSTGAQVRIAYESIEGSEHSVSFTPYDCARQFQIGDEIRIDFGGAMIRVTDLRSDHCLTKVVHGGPVGSNKASDTDRELDLTPITEKDAAAIEIGKRMGIRNFALSFANSADNVKQMRELCGSKSCLISKIESRSGLANLLNIIEETDEILIDRGDLSRQVPLEKIPFLQRGIISVAKAKKTPVFVATNLLETMIHTHLPTRAELNDVVSTLLMGADGAVLAAETAIGKYPVEATKMIRTLADEVNKLTPYSTIEEILNS